MKYPKLDNANLLELMKNSHGLVYEDKEMVLWFHNASCC